MERKLRELVDRTNRIFAIKIVAAEVMVHQKCIFQQLKITAHCTGVYQNFKTFNPVM